MTFIVIPQEQEVMAHQKAISDMAAFHRIAAGQIQTKTATMIEHLHRWDSAKAHAYQAWADHMVQSSLLMALQCDDLATQLQQSIDAMVRLDKAIAQAMTPQP